MFLRSARGDTLFVTVFLSDPFNLYPINPFPHIYLFSSRFSSHNFFRPRLFSFFFFLAFYFPSLWRRLFFGAENGMLIYSRVSVDLGGRARVCWPLLCLCRPICIFERCLASNPKSCHCRRATNFWPSMPHENIKEIKNIIFEMLFLESKSFLRVTLECGWDLA